MSIKKLTKHWQLIIIGILALVPVLWFRHNYTVIFGDYFPWYLNSHSTFSHDMLLWDSINGGQPSFWPNCSFGLEPIWWLFQSIHLPVNVVQIIFYTFSMLGSGLSMYFLASTIYKNQKIVPLVASTLFMFCVYRLEWIWWPGFLWTLGFLPLLMALYVKIVENSRNHLSVTKYILLFIVASMVLLCGQGIDVSLRVISLVSVGLFTASRGLRMVLYV